MNDLDVTGLRKSYGRFTAVDDVGFTVPAGGSLGLVGESGSGKSTTARLLLGLERPDAGSVLVCGRPVAAVSRRERARLIQIVFQDPFGSLDPRLTVEDCLTEVLKLHFPAPSYGKRVGELLEQVGLGPREAGALPRQLSGGQRQRVAIARALAVQPKVLVLDEAVAALDVSVQAQILGLLADIRAAEEVSYVFITHDLAVVGCVADQVAVMRHGRVVESGPTRQVLTSPQHDYTRLLLDSVPRAAF
ncbi:ABC transporter ATP-binding protein [Nonomuraea soli]|uniref:ABC-type glutathione transport system ATPase component n=1 Tax=Nonomuraea soli TaxID=1032476 RepID=A0A7W0CD79_9ACTN|nr:ATP-binding cassette domain-containing protein [Nonomuraea soli]MBA2889005.1 ABC-type glutathione transport system ATPase component [Nonomuraea soli]